MKTETEVKSFILNKQNTAKKYSKQQDFFSMLITRHLVYKPSVESLVEFLTSGLDPENWEPGSWKAIEAQEILDFVKSK